MTKITATLCPDEERPDFLRKHLKQHCINYELYVFSLMDTASEDYDAGYWNFYNLSNNSFFMAPVVNKSMLRMHWEYNGYRGRMSSVAAGVSINLMALSHFSYHRKDKLFSKNFHHLRDYALEHEEANHILSFID